MLTRVALHQTQLRMPGLSLGPKGVAMGAKGLVLLTGLDRLAAFLSVISEGPSAAQIFGSLKVFRVKSQLGAKELVLTMTVDDSPRLDAIAEAARLAGGLTFTGSFRQFVAWRDAAAPFGYDVADLLASGADFELYHSSFSQTYALDQELSLRDFVARLSPVIDFGRPHSDAPRWLTCEAGLGPAMMQYLLRTGIDAQVGLATVPAASALDEPTTRYVFYVASLPARMTQLFSATPGLAMFEPMTQGVGVQSGYRHPVNLGACSVFDPEGLVLFRAAGGALTFARRPLLTSLSSVMPILGLSAPEPLEARAEPAGARLPIRVVRDDRPWSKVHATWVDSAELGLLRKLVYVLGRATLRSATIAFVDGAACVLSPTGIDALPIGRFFCQKTDKIFLEAGFSIAPELSSSVLIEALGGERGALIFIRHDGSIVGIEERSFVRLETALVHATAWTGLEGDPIAEELRTELPELVLSDPGLLPMRDVGRLPEGRDAAG